MKKLINTISNYLIVMFTCLLGLAIGFIICTVFSTYNKSSSTLNIIKLDSKKHENSYFKNRPNSGLVHVVNEDPTIDRDIKYATDDNFTGKKIYSHPACLLQKNTMVKLKKANDEFKTLGYRIKIWDAYRPADVQKQLWSIVSDSRFIANPGKSGSRHNRGAAVDITLVDNKNNEVLMPTKFDEFNEKAYRNAPTSAEAKKNVDLLTNIMTKHGFNTIETEWWHYDDSDADSYPLLNIPFKDLE